MKTFSHKDNFPNLRKIIFLCFSIIFFGIIFFLVRWQFVEVANFQGLAAERYQSKSLSSIRGDILAKNGETLAYSEPRWDVYAYIGDMREAEAPTTTRSALQTRQEFITKVSTILGNSESDITLKLELLSCPIWGRVKTKVEGENKNEILNGLKSSYLVSKGQFANEVADILGMTTSQVDAELDYCPIWVDISKKIDYETKIKLETIPRTNFLNNVKTKFDASDNLIRCILKEDESKQCNELRSNVSEDELRKLTSYIISNRGNAYLVGVNFEFTSQRLYPENELAAHIIGFLGRDLNANDIGRGGLEQKYDGVLEPQEGFIAGETDSQGNLIALSDSVSIRAKRGSTIKTTIDKNIQEILEKKLKEGVEQYEAKSGSAVIMDPKLGSIIAMTSYPTFNPNEYYNVEDVANFTNGGVSIPYEVGSVMKVVTMSAAVEELGIEGDEIVVNGHDGCIEVKASEDEYDIRKLCTFDKMPKGPLTASQALISSDNIAFIELGTRLGKEKMHKYLSAFGIGKSTVIDVSGESIGYLPALDDPYAWHPVDVGVFSYGHGYQLNLVQATRAVAAVANDGWIMQPYLVSEIIDGNGRSKVFDPVPVEKAVSVETTKKVTVMMEELYKQHSDQGFRHIKNYPIAAKSGTALIPYKDKAGYSSDINATYIGFDSTEEARFIMAIKLEAPQAVKKLSFYSARPLWMSTFDELKGHLGMQLREE